RPDRPPLPRNHRSYPRPAKTRRSPPERQQLLSTEMVRTAELLVSELITNAVQYAGTGSVSLAVCLDEAVLRIEVCDTSPVLPQPALPDADSEGGRGLFLVAALADRYHAEPTETGKRCWAEIDLTSKPSQEVACFLPSQRS
ncbi:ATP-binding protein, partial [Streptomyces sp. NPDC006186]|uniref:ATP-binding protein n=1 Tax=Streptomyces sp. NPDC006186 TaxID=3155248 RepID=UPI0033B8E1A5